MRTQTYYPRTSILDEDFDSGEGDNAVVAFIAGELICGNPRQHIYEVRTRMEDGQ